MCWMKGVIPLLPLYAFVVWTGTILPSTWLFSCLSVHYNTIITIVIAELNPMYCTSWCLTFNYVTPAHDLEIYAYFPDYTPPQPYLINVKPRAPAAPITSKLKMNVTLEQTTKAQKGIEVQLYSFFNLVARWGRWSMERPDRFTPGRNPVPIV